MLTVTPATVTISDNGILRSTQFDDIYSSSAGGIDECLHVFLGGNDFKSRIKKANQFTIAEIGFGTGINFLATCNEWELHSHPDATLHYISIEKHPLAIEDLKCFYSKLNGSFSLTEELLALYPLPISGAHRFHFNKQNITLTLIFEDALTALVESTFAVDAWFLDGFCPSKNPELWSLDIAKEIFRLTKTNGTFSSYSTAGAVKKNLSEAGFQISKLTGFSCKREMLTGVRTDGTPDNQYPINKKSWLLNKVRRSASKHALVIGGGLAGSAISAALANRGWQITLIDRHKALATEASGNTNAILMPRLSVDHDLQAQLTLLGYFYSLRYLNKLQAYSKESLWQPCGAIQLPRDHAQLNRMQQIASQENLPLDLLHSVSKSEASDLSNCGLAQGGWYFPLAGWVIPHAICTTLLNQHSNISFIGETEVAALENRNGIWHALDSKHTDVAKAEVVVLANALSVNKFEQTNWCRLNPKRGQITLIPNTQCNINPTKVVCADAYITPTVDNHFVLGATFVANDTNTDTRAAEHQDNFDKISNIIPSFSPPSIESVTGRAAIRAVSADRLPIVGPAADEISFNRIFAKAALGSTNTRYPIPDYFDGLYIATGFGSRGMAWIPICAETLACAINNEPGPLTQPLSNAIHPNRILMKQLIKSVQCAQ